MQAPVPVVVIIEVDGLHDLYGHPVVQLLAGIQGLGLLIVGHQMGVGHMDIHAPALGDLPLQIVEPQVHRPAVPEFAAPVDVHPQAPVAHVHQAVVQICFLRASLDIAGHQGAIGHLFRDGVHQLAARQPEHCPVLLHGLLQGGAGEEPHLLGLLPLLHDLLDGVVEIILALLLGQVVFEFKGQIVAELGLCHRRHRHIPGKHQPVRQDHRRLSPAHTGRRKGRLQSIRHGIVEVDHPIRHQVVRHLGADPLLHLPAGYGQDLHHGFTDIKRRQLTSHVVSS